MINRDQTDSVRFLYWVGTAELCKDISTRVSTQLENQQGLVFEDLSYISIIEDKDGELTFWTIAGRDEFEDPNFLRVAQWLWDNHARDN